MQKNKSWVSVKHQRVYEMLKRIGHTPLKALEIVIDASRGDKHALTWIRIARCQGRATQEAGNGQTAQG